MTDGSRSRAAGILGTVSGFLLGLVLLFSAWAKALDPEGFAQLIVERGLMPAALAFWAGIAVIAFEAALGAALAVNLRRPVVLVPAALMMFFFLALSAWTYVYPSKEASSSCGCFGNLIASSPGQALARDVVLVALALLSFLGRPRRPAGGWRAALAGLAAVAFGAFAWAAPSLPLDNLATRLKPGITAASLRIDELIPELQDGTRLVLLLDRADEATRAEIARVNEKLALARPDAVFGLAKQDDALANEFQWTAGPAFEVRDAPQSMLKPFYRRLPRAFLVDDGRIVKVWERIPGDDVLAALAEGRMP
ncbi:MAG: hypothetical protein MUE47_09200 [Acidobacteria bacterium]|nr:hypothetical protein [Acidobacteriota bacterium]